MKRKFREDRIDSTLSYENEVSKGLPKNKIFEHDYYLQGRWVFGTG